MKRFTALRTVLASLLVLTVCLGAADYLIDDSLALRTSDSLPSGPTVTVSAAGITIPVSENTQVVYEARLFGVLPLKRVAVQRFDDGLTLCPGGTVFGAKMFTDGLAVIGFSDIDCTDGSARPAYDAGIRPKDIILRINGIPVTTTESMTELVGSCNGTPLVITVRRDGDELDFTVTPSFSTSENRYKTGMWIRDNTSGIGTVTYVDPLTGAFGGLGHGICDADTGTVLPLSRGVIMEVSIQGIKRGSIGIPGELQGIFTANKTGTLLKNCNAGVFGIFTELPDGIRADSVLPIALKDEITDGPATILCTLGDDGIKTYEVIIRKIKNAFDNKNMEITVTDPALLACTGGIVQGMSGSPIIQDGKLIGAVTHVLVNDPARGYGIFIENMLEAAENSVN